MSTSPSKGDLRKSALDARDAMDAAVRVAAGEKLAARGLPFEIAAGTTVSGYSPIRSELDPAPLMRKLADVDPGQVREGLLRAASLAGLMQVEDPGACVTGRHRPLANKVPTAGRQ